MTADEQPRDESGRFGPVSKSHPEVELASSASGTFLFPPQKWPGGVAEYVEFWMTTPIDDQTLTNLTNAYAARRDQWANRHLEQWAEEFGNSQESIAFLKRGRHTEEEIQAFHDSAREREIAKLDQERPRRIALHNARNIARAAQMYANRFRIPEDERQTLLDTPVFYNSDGEPWGVGELWESWHLDEIMPDGLTDAHYSQRRQFADVR